MTNPTTDNSKQSVVQNLRSIRDQINHEIKDMTFEQERAYLDQLLAGKPVASAYQHPPDNEPAA